MMLGLVKMNKVMFITLDIMLVLEIVDFLFHLREEENYQGEQG